MNKLWTPNQNQINASNVFSFIAFVNDKYKTAISDMRELYLWSIKNKESFWDSVWCFCNIKASTKGNIILKKSAIFKENKFFPEAKLNYTENMFNKINDDIAIIFVSEDMIERKISYKELYIAVAKMTKILQSYGVKKGDVVAGYVSNIPETIVAFLATAALGAVWCSCSADFGVSAAIDRLGQVSPKILFAVDGYFYKNKSFDVIDKVIEIGSNLDTVEKVIIIQHGGTIDIAYDEKYINFNSAMESAEYEDIIYEQVEFNHPLYILFTSGTTGAPKCIVHTVGGALIQHMKEHSLHCDIKEKDVVFYFTTCGWMMWNWLVSVLATKATIVLFDGFPMYNNNLLFEMVDKYGITLLGASAKLIDIMYKAELKPINTHSLATLRTITSTGSPLSIELFKYVYENIKQNVHLASISGGTDIVSCFVLGYPTESVYAGEIQGAGLGMEVDVYNDDGQTAMIGEKGNLVCVAPFPSQPLCFWNDPEGNKYHNAYYNVYENIWCHGDWIEKTPNNGFIIYGRSDAVLNPAGVRIGTAEIYEQVNTIEEVSESVAVGQRWNGDERIVLFVVLKTGFLLTEELKKKIKNKIKDNTTSRHVPEIIIDVPEVPRTRNGKISELAVKAVIHGQEVKNKASLDNPDALVYYNNIVELQ